MSMFKKILDIVPSALVSRAFGQVCAVEFPPRVQHVINRGFAAAVRLDRSEASKGIDEYSSLHELFTRELKPGCRPLDSASVIAPVDGKLSFMAPLKDGMLIEAKGRAYDVGTLVGGSDIGEPFKESFAFIIYLSPANYHRIHSPVCGCVTAMSYVPGRLLPVNRIGYMLTDDLLPSNERLTSFMVDRDGHRVALVKVGATCVGRISVVYDDMKTNSSCVRKPLYKELEKPWAVEAGSQIGCFDLGSTVVVLVDSKGFVPSPSLKVGQKISLGTALGSWN